MDLSRAAEADAIELNIPGLSAGLKMYLHGTDDRMISAKLRQEGCWEAYETELTLQILKPGDVYVDVGANIGYYTLLAAARAGEQGQVLAYEPDPQNFALLKANVALNHLTQVHLFPYGLYDQNQDAALFLSRDNFGDHRLYDSPADTAGAERESRKITLVNGAEHVSQWTQQIDFLKIDTQGAEYFVLKGLMPLILRNRHHLHIMLEFCPYGIRHSGGDGHAFLQLLEEMNMQFQIVDHQQRCLIPAQIHHFAEWVEAMAQEPQNEGFINLLISPKGSDGC